MPSPSTFAAIYAGTGRNQIPAQVLSTTTETIVLMNTDTGTTPAVLSVPTGVPGTTTGVGSASPLNTSGNPAIISKSGRFYGPPIGSTDQPFHGPNAFNGVPFVLRVNGLFTSGVASNDLKISLYLGSSATIGSDSVISAALTTGTSGNFGAVSGKFSASFKLMWDITTGKLDGVIESGSFIVPAGVAATVVGGTAVTEVSAAAVSNLQFVVSSKWNASNAGNTVQVTEFSLSDY